jgi:hypothetical protein
MIAFDLQCENGHTFEGWFESSKAFDEQKKRSLVSCPVCNTISVSKSLSSFGIIKSSLSSEKVQIDQQSVLKKIGKKFIDFIEKNFDDVGVDFTKEALKIHYGVTEPRNIKGVSTQEDEKLLKEEGIDFIKIPMPVEKNEPDA